MQGPGLVTEHDHGYCRISIVDKLQQFDPAAITQIDIEQDKIGCPFGQ